MKEQKARLFNLSLLRMVSARNFLSLLKGGFLAWICLYGFSLFIWYGLDWLSGLVNQTSGISFDKWIDPIFHKSISFWLILIVFGWLIVSTGIKYVFRRVADFFYDLSKYSTVEIIIAVLLFVILPWLPFYVLPGWLALAFPLGFMVLGAFITMLEREARKCPTLRDIFEIVDVKSILPNDYYNTSMDKEEIVKLIREVYSNETWEEQIQTIADIFVRLTEKKKSIEDVGLGEDLDEEDEEDTFDKS